MLKKIITIFSLLFINLFWVENTFSDSILVENIFSDISSSYKYKKQLQTLYDKWIIKQDSSWKFNPNLLLNRDEFVWILMWVICKDCIQPETDIEFIKKYETKQIFFDINKKNKYFYCIAEANKNQFVIGYHESTKCSNWTQKEWLRPFCPNNTIILEEAIAVILRASWILSNLDSEKIIQDIRDWKITEKIADDVLPINPDWNPYSFYPALRKALEFEVVDVDINWNTITKTLIEKINWKLNPKQAISKEKFLNIAYLILKSNSCNEKIENNLALKMIIYDEICNENKTNCKLSKLDNQNNIYDFDWEVKTTCEKWISKTRWYIWRFYNHEIGEEIKKYTKYIDNYKFLYNWTWTVYLRVIDKCWNTAEVYNTIKIVDKKIDNLNVSINANPIFWNWPLLVNFKWIVFWWVLPYKYSWNFWDWNNWFWKNIENLFKIKWVYKVSLIVTDINWLKWSATVLIQVINNKCDIDLDKDSVLDCYDLCPLIKWKIKNKGCPIYNINKIDDLKNSCEYTGSDIIFWNILCNICPCLTSLDFVSSLRKCDIIFPAITSLDSKNIYSKWELYRIEK